MGIFRYSLERFGLGGENGSIRYDLQILEMEVL